MSPQQRAQIQARLEQVAEQRAKDQRQHDPVYLMRTKTITRAEANVLFPSAHPLASMKKPAASVTDKRVTNAKSSADRVAKHKAKNPEAVRLANAAIKRAARAKKAKP